jgi:hypothetical protein
MRVDHAEARMRERSLALHLPPVVFEELQQVSASEGSGIEDFVRAAVEEKLADMRTARYFRERGPWRALPGRRRPRRSGSTSDSSR